MSPSKSPAQPSHNLPQRELTLWDSVAIIIGIIVGAGIFQTAPMVAGGVSSGLQLLLVWAVGGALSVIGALCYAELATAFPRVGGDYVYLNRAYGNWAGFLFAWARLSIIQTGSLGLLAYVFARYANTILPLEKLVPATWNSELLYAQLVIVVLSLLNLAGTRQGKWNQRILTSAKVLGLGAIILVAFLFTSNSPLLTETVSSEGSWSGIEFALILVMFTYGGWNEAAYVAAEVQNPNRNIVRSLVIGTTIVTGLYLLINSAYLYVLGLEGLRQTQAVATDVVSGALNLPDSSATPALIMSLLVIVSVLGAINGEIFTGARISYALGEEHRVFHFLGTWDNKKNSPTRAIIAQTFITFALVTTAGIWGGESGFDNLMKFTAPIFWVFFTLTAVSVIVLRQREPNLERPFRTPCYPLLPLLFCAACLFMLYSSGTYAWSSEHPHDRVWLGIAATILLAGLPLYLFSRYLTGSMGNPTNNPHT